MATSIKISDLVEMPNTIVSNDFFPLVDSSSLTTYRSNVVQLGTWLSTSGSALSSSYASASSISVSSSWASSSFTSSTSVTLIYPNTSTASYSVNGGSSSFSVSSSYAGTSSVTTGTSSYSSFSISSSYARTASLSDTASYVNFTATNIPQIASSSISSSWASSSFSSSYSVTSSYSLSSSYSSTSSFVTSAGSKIKAFGWMLWQKTVIRNTQIFFGYNMYSASYLGVVYQHAETPSTTSYGTDHAWLIHMSEPLPSTDYVVVGGLGGSPPTEYGALMNYPFGKRSTTAFTASLVFYGGGSFNDGSGGEPTFFPLMVLHS